MKLYLPFMVIILLTFGRVSPSNRQGIYFDDSDPAIMVLGNDAYYEIGFRKSNGSIAYITDKSTGEPATLGSRYECLWGAVFPDGTPEYVGGCNFNAAVCVSALPDISQAGVRTTSRTVSWLPTRAHPSASVPLPPNPLQTDPLASDSSAVASTHWVTSPTARIS